MKTLSKRVDRLETELALLKLRLAGFASRKGTVSFRGMAKQLVPEEELERGLEEAKRGFTENRVRMERMRRACRTMDNLRKKTKGVRFDSVRVIRATRDSR